MLTIQLALLCAPMDWLTGPGGVPSAKNAVLGAGSAPRDMWLKIDDDQTAEETQLPSAAATYAKSQDTHVQLKWHVASLEEHLPRGSPALAYYLCRTYGNEVGKAAAYLERAKAWSWRHADILWIDKLPPHFELSPSFPNYTATFKVMRGSGPGWAPESVKAAARGRELDMCPDVKQEMLHARCYLNPATRLPEWLQLSLPTDSCTVHYRGCLGIEPDNALWRYKFLESAFYLRRRGAPQSNAGGTRDPPLILNGEWLEVTHMPHGGAHMTDAGLLWYFLARGSGLWFYSGKTLVVNDIVDIAFFLNMSFASTDGVYLHHSLEGQKGIDGTRLPRVRLDAQATKGAVLRAALQRLPPMGFDTVITLRHMPWSLGLQQAFTAGFYKTEILSLPRRSGGFNDQECPPRINVNSPFAWGYESSRTTCRCSTKPLTRVDCCDNACSHQQCRHYLMMKKP